jgi:hypothetical protein
MTDFEASNLKAVHPLICGETPSPSIRQITGLTAVELESGRINLETHTDERPSGQLRSMAASRLFAWIAARGHHFTVDRNAKFVRPLTPKRIYLANDWGVERTCRNGYLRCIDLPYLQANHTRRLPSSPSSLRDHEHRQGRMLRAAAYARIGWRDGAKVLIRFEEVFSSRQSMKTTLPM